MKCVICHLTVKILKSVGLHVSFLSTNQPQAETTVYETHTYSGVRGSPRQYLQAGPSTRLCAGFVSKFVIL